MSAAANLDHRDDSLFANHQIQLQVAQVEIARDQQVAPIDQILGYRVLGSFTERRNGTVTSRAQVALPGQWTAATGG